MALQDLTGVPNGVGSRNQVSSWLGGDLAAGAQLWGRYSGQGYPVTPPNTRRTPAGAAQGSPIPPSWWDIHVASS